MGGKLLARAAAAGFVGIAFAMTLVQMREEPAPPARLQPIVNAARKDLLPDRLRACARLGEAALTSPDCLAAWAEKRRRFFGVDHPEAYAELMGADPTTGAQPPAAPGPEHD